MFEKRWLKQGRQTRITPLVREVADSINGEGLELIQNISNYIVSIKRRTARELEEKEGITKEEEFLATADQLLTNHHWIKGCHTVGTIFRALCIAKGIPAILIETLDKSWLESWKGSEMPRRVEGHVFVDVFINGEWYTINPATRDLVYNYTDYSGGKRKYVKIGQGRDRSHIRIPTDHHGFRRWILRNHKKFI